MGAEAINRRNFLEHAGRAAGGMALGAVALSLGCDEESAPEPQPTKPIRLGLIGVGRRGKTLLKGFQTFKACDIRAVCDVDDLALDAASSLAGPSAKACKDYREVLDRDDIDAVVIATPDHWHAIMFLHACAAGKDIYVEKPLGVCVTEGRRMVQAARQAGRIVQMGTQQLSPRHYRQAREIVRQGTLGKVTMVRAWNARNILPGRGKPADCPPPPTLDWDKWLGPCPAVPFNPLRVTKEFRYFWDYSGGVLTDWGVHHFHTILDSMGYEPPLSVSAVGGRYLIDDITDYPDTLSVQYGFRDWLLELSICETNSKAPYDAEYGIEFCGADATLFLTRGGFAVYPERERGVKARTVGKPGQLNLLTQDFNTAHLRNFLLCLESREAPNSEIELGHQATNLAHIGNISYRVGRRLRWDGPNERFIADAEADQLLTRTYRAPYLLPGA